MAGIKPLDMAGNYNVGIGWELNRWLHEIVRSQENGWQEPYESRGSRTELWGTGGEIPPVYPTAVNERPVFETRLPFESWPLYWGVASCFPKI